MNHCFRLIAVVLSCCLPHLESLAQSTPSDGPNSNPPPNLSAADLAWMDLRAAAFVSDGQSPLPADREKRLEALAQRVAQMKRAAELAKQFRANYPGHAKANEARVQEVLALIGARHAGDATVEDRLVSAVTAIAGDRDAPESDRIRAVAAFQFNEAMRGKASKSERLGRIETVARSLTVSYPSQSQGYESLLVVAAASESDTKARELAQEVASGGGPFSLRQEAKYMVERFDLVGQPIAPLLQQGKAKAKHQDGQTTVVYTWASSSPGSMALAAKLKQSIPNARFIAVSLDEDTSAGSAKATEKSLPGEQEFDARGREGSVAQSLKLRRPGQVMLVDAQGIIREVRAEIDLARVLAKHGL